ncbi:hypothetical protein MVEN_00586300 [Mycena venus]|uniref:Uncharacterized protein n=1 Tax=Mycena venus TaxID=2733690 RepID=A0A8H6YPD5_9AGAR|nr:hypothetical protein MVEN_00586300 [Mycena venus]
MAPGLPLSISSLIVEDWFHGSFTKHPSSYHAAIPLHLRAVYNRSAGDFPNHCYQQHYTRSQRNWRIALVVAAYICSTIHAAVNWVYYSQAVNDNELSTGPGLLYSLTRLKVWIEGVGDTFFCINTFTADCLFIWRYWVVWNRRWLVIALPVLATISGAVLAGIIVSDEVVASQSSEPFAVAKKSADLTATLLITLRTFLLRRTGTGTRRSFLEISVESAVLYSVTLLTFFALDVEKTSNVYYAQNIHAQMTGIAPLFIILRDAAGYSRPADEWAAEPSGSNTSSTSAHSTTASKTDTEV